MEKEYLYHYTKLESLKSILRSNSFKTSDFSYANDYKEKYNCLESSKENISKYRYISFEKDELDYNSFSNPVMWYHYAEKHHGACLKVDKFRFEELCNPVLHSYIIYKDGISYIDKQNDILEYLMYKRTKWGYENEYRYIFNEDIKYICDFISCIDSIYFGAEVGKVEIGDCLNAHNEIMNRYKERSINVFRMFVEPKDGGLHGIELFPNK